MVPWHICSAILQPEAAVRAAAASGQDRQPCNPCKLRHTAALALTRTITQNLQLVDLGALKLDRLKLVTVDVGLDAKQRWAETQVREL